MPSRESDLEYYQKWLLEEPAGEICDCDKCEGVRYKYPVETAQLLLATRSKLEKPATKLGDPTSGLRTFETGATRDTEVSKIDPEGFISPLAEERFCKFMDRHRVQADGKIRDSDNWQRGIPLSVYAKSLTRHMLEFRKAHRGYRLTPKTAKDPQDLEEVLCSIVFNANGYLHELLKAKEAKVPEKTVANLPVGVPSAKARD